MKAYRAYVTAAKGSVLLGGVTRHESTPFETAEMAHHWLCAVLAANCEVHREISAWGWVMTDHPNPIREGECLLTFVGSVQ